ncbi:urokinase plasminogen activator surface receptor-like, partial [Pelobates cultripes]
SSLECYHFKGPVDQALEKQEAKECEINHHHCKSSLLTITGMLKGKVLVKGCAKKSDEYCNKTHTLSEKDIQTIETIMCCEGDLCNKDLVPVSDAESQKWGVECLACNGPPPACGGDDLPSMQCDSAENQCIQVSITTALNQATDPGAENGLECYSRSSPDSASSMKCRGEMTQCVDLIGDSNDNVVMSGCATETFCQGLYPRFKIPGWSRTVCCAKSLCNHGNNTAHHI